MINSRLLSIVLAAALRTAPDTADATGQLDGGASLHTSGKGWPPLPVYNFITSTVLHDTGSLEV
jgi:hypothetical protein